MPEINGILIFIVGGVVGCIIGFIISRITSGSKQKAAQQEALDNTKAELDHYKSQVSNHFDNSAKLMGQVASSYQALYTHMAGQSEALLDPTDAEVPFPQLKTPPVKEQEEPLADEEVAQESAEETLAAKEAAQESADETLAAKEDAQESAEEPSLAKKAEQEVPQSDDAEALHEKKDKN